MQYHRDKWDIIRDKFERNRLKKPHDSFKTINVKKQKKSA